VEPDGRAWIVQGEEWGGLIWRHVAGHDWERMPGGDAKDIGIGATGDVWLVGALPRDGGHMLYHWNGTGWNLSGGNGVSVAVDPGGIPWIVQDEVSGGLIWHLAP